MSLGWEWQVALEIFAYPSNNRVFYGPELNNDLFLNVVKSEVCNFADDNTLYSFDKKLDTIFLNIKCDPKNVLSWIQVNPLKANPSNFQFMILGDQQNTSFVFNVRLTTPDKLNCFELSLIIS